MLVLLSQEVFSMHTLVASSFCNEVAKLHVSIQTPSSLTTAGLTKFDTNGKFAIAVEQTLTHNCCKNDFFNPEVMTATFGYNNV